MGMIGVGRRPQPGAADGDDSGDHEHRDPGADDRMPRPRPREHHHGGDRDGLAPDSGEVERADRLGHAGV